MELNAYHSFNIARAARSACIYDYDLFQSLVCHLDSQASHRQTILPFTDHVHGS